MPRSAGAGSPGGHKSGGNKGGGGRSPGSPGSIARLHPSPPPPKEPTFYIGGANGVSLWVPPITLPHHHFTQLANSIKKYHVMSRFFVIIQSHHSGSTSLIYLHFSKNWPTPNHVKTQRNTRFNPIFAIQSSIHGKYDVIRIYLCRRWHISLRNDSYKYHGLGLFVWKAQCRDYCMRCFTAVKSLTHAHHDISNH